MTRSRWRLTAAAVAAALLTFLVAWAALAAGSSSSASSSSASSTSAAASDSDGGPHWGAPTLAAPEPVPTTVSRVAEPVAVAIPSQDIRAPLVGLGLNDDRTIEVPDDFSDAGWYELGPRPGEVGPAVIIGHVDSHSGPAVFYRLRHLAPGDQVVIDHADGTATRFVVERIEQHPKNAFPTDAVYGPTTGSELRLVTCGGEFDDRTGHYRDNVIVWATAA